MHNIYLCIIGNHSVQDWNVTLSLQGMELQEKKVQEVEKD